MNRRDFLKATAATPLLAGLSMAAFPTKARAESQLTLATTGGSWGNGIYTSFVTERGLDLSPARAQEIESVSATKLIAQCSTPPYSVLANSDADALLIAQNGCARDYDLDIVTNYKDIFRAAVMPETNGLRHWYAPFSLAIWGIGYNSKNVASAPSEFMDLWTEKYRGRVGIPAYGWRGIYIFHSVNKLLGGTEENVEPGIEAFGELVRKQKAVIVENMDQGLNLLQSGEIDAMPFPNGRCFTLQRKGVPIEFAFVPGAFLSRGGMVVAAHTEFAADAMRIVNASLSPEGQVSFTKKFLYPPANKKAELPTDMAHYAVKEEQLERVAQLDLLRINELRSVHLDQWNRKVLGG
jgi:putative spermidine/putrescine transport system substrate-binding protein